MKTIDRYLCAECAKTLRDSGVRHMRVPKLEAKDEEKQACEWCRNTCLYGRTFRIAYETRC